jgi:hypothetical protein
VQKGCKVIALLHEDIEKLPSGKVEAKPKGRSKLLEFRKKVQKGRLTQYWANADELANKAVVSLQQTITVSPGTGWVRGGSLATADVLEKLEVLRTENSELRKKIAEIEREDIEGLADGDFKVGIKGTFGQTGPYKFAQSYKAIVSWNEIVAEIGPRMLQAQYESAIRAWLSKFAAWKATRAVDADATMDENDFQTIRLQLCTLGLITLFLAKEGGHTAWALTPKGRKRTVELRTVKKTDPAPVPPSSTSALSQLMTGKAKKK